LLQLPTTAAELLATEGQVTEVIAKWRCEHQGCSNYPYTCWVAGLEPDDRGPGRVENHYPVPKGVLDIWNREIRRGVSTAQDPSENLRTLLRQERERRRSGRRDNNNNIEILSEVSSTLRELARLYGAKAQAELAAAAPPAEYVPFGGSHFPLRVAQAFFQWWYDHEEKEDIKDRIALIGNRAVEEKISVDNLRGLTVRDWNRKFQQPLACLLRMRQQLEVFVKEPLWETYIDDARGWDYSVFEPEVLEQLAREASLFILDLT
jgi:hypothetical protein